VLDWIGHRKSNPATQTGRLAVAAGRLIRQLCRTTGRRARRRSGFLYLDGHVRVYHGKHALPKAHVARMRISMPATSDYWVNDLTGDPLFVVTPKPTPGW